MNEVILKNKIDGEEEENVENEEQDMDVFMEDLIFADEEKKIEDLI